MSATETSADLQFLIDLSRAAGEKLLRCFDDKSDLGVEKKGRRDLVTSADLASERLILDSIRTQFPSDAILSEEAGATGLDRSDRVWIVDPLDGTTNFAHGHPLFSVSIALWVGGRPRLAVIHAPRIGETYWASTGGGAYLNGSRIHVSGASSLENALLATGFSYRRKELSEGALEVFGGLLVRAREIRRGGSACLDLAHTASGVFAGFWEYHLHPHDVAAGSLLVIEAGGVVSDVEGGDDFLFGGSLVAGVPTIHTALLKELQAGPGHPGR